MGRVREDQRREEKRRREKRREEKKREDQRREGVRRKKIQVCEKVEKSRNAAGAEPSGQMRDEKLHAVVARSTRASEKAKNTSPSEHFWKLRCRKSARCCGAKLICKSKCTKHTRCGPLLEVELSKECTPLWHEAHFQVKMHQTHHCQTTFGC